MRVGEYAMAPLLTPAECDDLIAAARERAEPGPAHLYGHGRYEIDPWVRDCEVRWILPGNSELQWLFRRLDAAVAGLVPGLRYDRHPANADLQIATYGPGGHFVPHVDRIASDPHVRVVSATCLLSGPDDFRGGRLWVDGDAQVPAGQGDLVAFSSLTLHAVEPVLSGSRTTLTRWYPRGGRR